MTDAPLWLQVLGPVATVIASTVAGVVAVRLGRAQIRINEGQKDIAAAQRDIAKMRVRMDLHDKRFEIAEAARDLIILSMREDGDQVRFNDLRRVVQQARFFFPPHIVEAANDLDGACVEASVFGRSASPHPDIKELEHQARLKVAKYHQIWPAPYAEVMMFADVK